MPWLLRVLFAYFATAFGVKVAEAQPAYVSPEVRADGTVTFRLRAPNARAVSVRGLRLPEPQAMTLGEDGLWSVTVGPLAPDLYGYFFDVDGARVLDPVNREVKKWLNMENQVLVPGTPPALHELQAVPHGVIHRHHYRSALRGADTPVMIYTPPGYETKAGQRFPVVYLLHGFGDDETAWTEVGRSQFIADNLLARGASVPAIIVMTNGHPVPIRGEYADYGPRNLAAFERDLLESVIAFVDGTYRTQATAASRAVMGLSMGGGQALTIGLTHPDVFQWVCGYSSATPESELETRFARLLTGEKPRLLWIGCGRDDFLIERNKTFIAWLEKNQITHTWSLTDGGHEWTIWRRYLAETLPLLFR